MNFYYLNREKEYEINKRIEADPEYKKYVTSINEKIDELEAMKVKKRNEIREKILNEIKSNARK